MKDQEKLTIKNIGIGLKYISSQAYYSDPKKVTGITDASVKIGTGWEVDYIKKDIFMKRIRDGLYNIKHMPEILKPVVSIDAFSII